MQTTTDYQLDLSNTSITAEVDLSAVTDNQASILSTLASQNDGTVLAQVKSVNDKLTTTNSKLTGINNLLI